MRSITLLLLTILLSTNINAQIKQASVEPFNNGQSIIVWSYSNKEVPVNIYWSTSPENIEQNGKLLAENVKGNYYVFYAPDSEVQSLHKAETNKRVYYAVKPLKGKAVVTATRLLDNFDNVSKLDNFKPVNNFREVGGYLNKDGKRVKWGKFYRSNELSTLNEKEIDFVKSLSIGTIFDLRGDKEVKNFPDKNVGAEMVYFKEPTADTPYDLYAGNPAKRLKMWGQMARANQGTFDYMVNSNRKYVNDYADLFSRMFKILVDEKPGKAILGHCAGGKDRTGAYMAVVLSALDVPKETIMYDYLLTGVYRQVVDDIELQYVKELNSLNDNEIKVVEPAWRVYPEYLQTFFDTIDKEYGSMDQYLLKKCGLTPEMKSKLKALYLED